MKNTLNFLLFALFFFAFSLQFNSCTGKKYSGCQCESIISVSGTKVVSPTHIEDFFSTYELAADGSCHTYMLIIFRWADEDLAKSNIRPPLAYEFQSLFGYFPTNMGMETIETSGDGINTYEITISEAADKTKPEGNRYGIWLKYVDGVTAENGSIMCKMIIEYRAYDEFAHTNGCLKDDIELN